MKLNKTYKKSLKLKYDSLTCNKATGRLHGLLVGKGYSCLLSKNQLLRIYQRRSDMAINNFLWGEPSTAMKKNYVYDPDEAVEEKWSLKQKEIESIKEGKLLFSRKESYWPLYYPISIPYIKSLIEADKFFRLSKCWNKKPITVYRATVSIQKLKMSGLNSCTSILSETKSFLRQASPNSLLKINLPSYFPYIRIYEFDDCWRPYEAEVLLPPCEFKIVKTHIKELSSYTANQKAEIKVRPLNLAKVFLERMKNPPADFPRTYLSDPRYQYAEAMAMLEKYIDAEVDKSFIQIGKRTIKELPDPVIEFTHGNEPNIE